MFQGKSPDRKQGGAVMEPTQEAAATIAWFTEFQEHCVISNGIIPEWFHGIISRKAAEEMLLSKPPGYFLIRVSESRIGYTLSYSADDRSRHFIIEVLRDGHYIILGEDTRHRSLQDLVDFHRRFPIMPFNEVLTVACGQVSKDKTDYAELLFTKRDPMKPNQAPLPKNCPPLTNTNKTHLKPSEETPPALPIRPITMKESVVSRTHSNKALPAVPSSYPPRLYPCLETELPTFKQQHPTMVDTSFTPVALPRKKLPPNVSISTPADQPPKLPARSSILPRDRTPGPTPDTPPRTHEVISSKRPFNRPNTQLSQDESCHNQAQSGRNQEGKSAVINNIKRKFQKKRTSSQDPLYSEICIEVGEREGEQSVASATENEYQELSEQHCSTHPLSTFTPFKPVDCGLPPEYLHPPPFAPGY